MIVLPPLGGLTKSGWIVPNRNAIFLSIAVNFAAQNGIGKVTIGCNAEDETEFPDCRMAFIQMFNTMLTTAEVPVEVWAPYIDWPKWKIVALAKQHQISEREIWTCYQPKETGPCGECPACRKLLAAFRAESEQCEMRPC
jgi:Predicted PP-loop superfamily ATPase